MYKITFKGMAGEPMFVDDVKGGIIMDSWVNDKKARMVVGKTAFYTGDIKQIVKIEKSEAEVAKTLPNTIDRDYQNFRNKMLALSVEKRAGILRIAKMIWNAHTKAPLTDEIKAQIVERQLTYLTENPKCIYANPKVYRDLIPKYGNLAQIDSFNPIQNILPKMTLRMVENLIQTDLQYSAR